MNLNNFKKNIRINGKSAPSPLGEGWGEVGN